MVLKAYAAVCALAGDLAESLCGWYISKQLRSSLSHSNIAYLIGLLEGEHFTEY